MNSLNQPATILGLAMISVGIFWSVAQPAKADFLGMQII